ncbi:MAG: alpha/beta hydrolase [Anaerolineales bacterium]
MKRFKEERSTVPGGPSNLHVEIHRAHRPDRSPVVLLHGLGSSSQDWPLQVPVLSEHRQVYAVDLPGHGLSPPLAGWPSMADYAGELACWMRAAGLGAAHIVGLSLGGLLALQLGVDDPTLVKSLTIVNAFSRMSMDVRAGLHSAGRLLLLLFGRMDWLGAWVASALFPGDGQEPLRELAAARIAANPRRSYLQAVLAIARFNLEQRLGEIRCPVLIVAGDRDLIVPLDAKMQLAGHIPHSSYAIIPGSGHVTPVDAGERFNGELVKFLLEND